MKETPKAKAGRHKKIGSREEPISNNQPTLAELGITKRLSHVAQQAASVPAKKLATANNQGELSPLEIGIHALHAVPKAEGGRGKKGGLSEYAEKVGRDKGTISRYRDAAEVFIEANCCNIATVYPWTERTFHLAAVHRLPRPCWQAACEWLAANKEAADWPAIAARGNDATLGFFVLARRSHEQDCVGHERAPRTPG
ncbi:MAG: hypothetical protein HYX68_17980 [Planctomycetes bacterium]|nr:hypothetical protein [Planctomycetota bacterium]